jgi:glycosyltransferase involved in cell wall biosynthesis
VSDERASILVVCHVSAAEMAVAAARELYLRSDAGVDDGGDVNRHAPVDVLCYGRASEDRPSPAGARLVGPAVHDTMSRPRALRIIVALRRHRYKVVALSQPSLGLSRARGLLLACSYFVSGGQSVILDPAAKKEIAPITLGLVLTDVARWTGLHMLSRGLAAGAARVLAALSSGVSPAQRLAERGSVVYLRTDIDLRIAPLSAGGSVAHTEGILQALVDRDHDVAYWGTGEVDGIPASIERRRLPALLKGNLPTEIAELLSGIGQGLIVGHRRSARPTAFIYQRYSLNNLAGVILSRRWDVPLVLEANGSEAKWRQGFGTLKYPKLAYACERLILRQAEIVTAVSRNAAEDLLAAGAQADRVRVVPNGVSIRRFADAAPIPLPRSLDGAFTICFVGLFYPWHGVRYLAQAFALLHARRPEARLLLVGDGEELPIVRAILDSNGAIGATHFAGLVPRSEAPGYMAASDVLVSPHADVHHFIGSPIKLFEYMATGKPIVATRVGQIPDVLTDGTTALLVPPADPPAMTAALERLLADRSLGERLGRAARSEAQEHSWDARLASTLGLGPPPSADGAGPPV